MALDQTPEECERKSHRIKYFPPNRETALQLSALVDAAIAASPRPSLDPSNPDEIWQEAFGHTNEFALLTARPSDYYKGEERYQEWNINRTVLVGPAIDDLPPGARQMDLTAYIRNARATVPGVPLSLIRQERVPPSPLVQVGRQIERIIKWARSLFSGSEEDYA